MAKNNNPYKWGYQRLISQNGFESYKVGPFSPVIWPMGWNNPI